jgi:hypothetical protein
VAQTIGAWLAGEVRLSSTELVDQLAALLDELADPALYRARGTSPAAKL